MSQYVDSSALLKRYLEEDESERYEELLVADQEWVTVRHTAVEVRRALVRALDGEALSAVRENFADDWAAARVVALDDATCDYAAEFAEATGLQTLDALHLGAAHRVGAGRLPFLTADVRLAQVARSLGWTVLGS